MDRYGASRLACSGCENDNMREQIVFNLARENTQFTNLCDKNLAGATMSVVTSGSSETLHIHEYDFIAKTLLPDCYVWLGVLFGLVLNMP